MRQLEPGFVLHSRPYRESSLLLEIFTRAGGRIGLVAKGVRRSRRSRAGLLQPFQPLLLSWSGRGELGVLTQVEREPGASQGLAGEALAMGFYLNELLMRLLPRNDPHETIYDAYRQALALLDEPAGDHESALRHFELRLLEGLGYGIEFDRDGETGQPVDDDALYVIDLEHGPVRLGGNPRSELQAHGASLKELQRGHFATDRARREARRLMAGVIRHYLGGEEPRSRQLFRKTGQTQ